MTQTLKAGRYQIQGVLGQGSQGETLDAVDTERQKPVAIKRFSVRGLGMSSFIVAASYGGLYLLGSVIQLVAESEAAEAFNSGNPFAALGSLQTLSIGGIVSLLASATGVA